MFRKAYILKDLYSNQYASDLSRPSEYKGKGYPNLVLDNEESMAWIFDEILNEEMIEFMTVADRGYYLFEIKTIIVKDNK